MASRYQVEVKLVSATNLKNVNWRNGPIHPYAVVWVDPTQKCSTKADKTGDTQPNWDETLVVPLSATIGDSTLYIDVLHAQSESEAKPIIIGSTKLRLENVQNDVGIGHHASRNLKLKRPSGRPQGAVDMKVILKDNGHQTQHAAGDAPAYGGVPPPAAEMPREFNPSPLPAYVSPYGSGAPPPTSNVSSVYSAPPVYSGAPPASNVSSVYSAPPVYSGAPPTSNVYSSYSAPPSSAAYSGYSAPPAPYGGAPYGQAGPQSYGYGQAGQQSYGYGQSSGQQSYGYGQRLEGQTEEKKKTKFGMGAGLAMGAVAGGLGALVIGKGVEKLEDKIADRAVEKVEYDMAFDSSDD